MAQTSSKQCDLCSQEDGKHFCYDCQRALCDICKKKHEKIPSLVDHKLTDLQQVDLSSFNTRSNCESHRTEFIIYCKTCLCLVCLKCVTSIHAGHEFCDIEKVVSDERQDVATTITVLKSKVKALLDLKEKIECHHLEKNKANAEKVLTEIAETFKDLAQLIEYKKQIKQTEVKDFEELERQQLESFLRNVDRVLRTYTQLREELENLLTMKHDTTFHLCYKTLKHDVENQDSIPDEPTLNEIQAFDARDVYKEILDFINSKFEMRLCGNCVDQGKQIDELMKESQESTECIQRDQLRIAELTMELKDAKSTHLAETNQLQDKLKAEMKESKKAVERITEIEHQLKTQTDKNKGDQLRMTELDTKLKDAKSTHLAEKNQLQDELKSKMKASKKAEETIDELQNQLKSLTDKNESDQLRMTELDTKLKDAKSTHLAEKKQLQDELKSKMKASKKAEETIAELQNPLKSLTDKNERIESFIEKKWSCHLEDPGKVMDQLLYNKAIQQLQNNLKCAAFIETKTTPINNQQLAQWENSASGKRIILVHGSVGHIASDIIVCPTSRGSISEYGKAIIEAGGPVMESHFKGIFKSSEISVSTETGNLPCFLVAYFSVPVFKPGSQMVAQMYKSIQDLFSVIDKTHLESVVIPINLADGIPENTFLHWFIKAFESYQHKMININQIFLCTEDEHISNKLSVLKDGINESFSMFDFSPMFEEPKDQALKSKRKQADITITLVEGKMVDQQVDVIVNSSNKELDLKKGAISSSILKAAGDCILKECKDKHPNGIAYGQVMTTSAGRLPYKLICHGALPCWKPTANISSQILSKLVFSCLLCAENVSSKSIAFPVFGTGNLEYPWDEVAKTMISTIKKYGRKYPDTLLKDVKVVLFDKDLESIQAFKRETEMLKCVRLMKEDHLPPPLEILECRCKCVRVIIEPLGCLKAHHCQAIALFYEEEPESKKLTNGFDAQFQEKYNFWILSILAGVTESGLKNAFNMVLKFADLKRLSTLAVVTMKGKGVMQYTKQCVMFRDNVNALEINRYLKVLKIMIPDPDRTTFDILLRETVKRQEEEKTRWSNVIKFSSVSKPQWKYVNYSEIDQSSKLMVTVVGSDKKDISELKKKFEEEITILKVKLVEDL